MSTKPRLIAAHHIALLLLSTAAPHSDEHADIVELNDAGIWKALEELDLVLEEDQLWHLTKRGQQYVEALLALPLPGASTPASSRKSRLARVLRAASAPGVRRRRASQADVRGPKRQIKRAIAAHPEASEVDPKLQSPSADSDDGEAPPRPPNPKPIPDIQPAATEAERFKQAEALFNRGFGLNEVAETLELNADELERRYFR